MSDKTAFNLLCVLQIIFMIAMVVSAWQRNIYTEVACAAFWLFYEIKAHHEIERRVNV